ncbi:MAG: tetratricopeptide repeat protein [Gammaproteobacteria bacterium]|nr:tetratricopeptide repeat protein [Gammaproteobacteria bacterium]
MSPVLLASSADSRISRGESLLEQGKYQQALAVFKDVFEKHKNSAENQLAYDYSRLGQAYLKLGKYAEAEEFLQKATKALKNQLGSKHTDYAFSLKRLADVYKHKGEYEKSLKLYKNALGILENNPGKQSEQYVKALYNLADLYDSMGEFDKSLELFRESEQSGRKIFGTGHPEYATILNSFAGLYQSTAKYKEASKYYQQSMLIRKQKLGQQHPLYASSLNNVAGLLKKVGQYKKALPYYQNALKINKLALGESHPDYAVNLNNLALINKKLGNYSKALSQYRASVAAWEKAVGDEHPSYAATLNNLALLLKNQDKYLEALPLYQKVLKIWGKVLGKEHPNYAKALNNLAFLEHKTGNTKQALKLYQQAVTTTEKSLGKKHPSYTNALNGLAGLYHSLGQYSEALSLYQESLSINAKVLGKDHPKYASSLNSLALLYEQMGAYNEALPLYRQAVEINRKTLGNEHVEYAASLNNLALLYNKLGDKSQALKAFHDVLAIQKKALGEKHTTYAVTQNNLAGLYKDMQKYEQAMPLYDNILAIQKKTLGEKHPDYAVTLNNLADLFYRTADFDKALPLYKKSLKIKKDSLGQNHPSIATGLNNLAGIYKAKKQYKKSLDYYDQALDIKARVLGKDHPSYINSLYGKASVLSAMKKYSDALRLFVSAQNLADAFIQSVFPVLAEEQKLQFAQSQSVNYHALLSLVNNKLSGNAEALKIALNAVLARKSIVFDAQSRLYDSIASNLDIESKQLWDKLAEVRSYLAKEIQAGELDDFAENYHSTIKGYQQKIFQLEKRLADKSPLVKQELLQHKVTFKEVVNQLGSNSALLEFVKIREIDWSSGNVSSSWKYLVFVLTGEGDIKLIDLGDADKLDVGLKKAISAFYTFPFIQAEQDRASKFLYQILWRPLGNYLAEKTDVIFSPDGALNLVPFVAMMDQQGDYLIESRQISYVSSGRDLARQGQAFKSQTGLFLAANPSFDLKVDNHKIVIQRQDDSRVRSSGFALQFTELPGTDREAKLIPANFTGKKTVVSGEAANEEAVIKSKRPEVLHLATHGFFLEDIPLLTTDGNRGSQLQRYIDSLPEGYENPLVRSGLAFAGANYAAFSTGIYDGVLTALEVSGMDLHGTDLVTLSACETGRGEVKTGEGVFGLRRAFALAGANNLMMSLWPVADEETALQMEVFYKNYSAGKSPVEALRITQIESIKRLRAKNSGYANPTLWAPFIIQRK